MKTVIKLKLKDTFIFDLYAYEKKGWKPKRTRNTVELEVDSEDTVYSVMARLQEMTGVPPGLQMLTCHSNGKSFHYDTPGTLAENDLLPTYASPIIVEYTDPSVRLEDPVLQRNTLRSLGFCVDDDLFPEESVMRQLVRHGDRKMRIDVTDNIRKDGGGRRMVLVVEAGDTVASIKEEVRRRRGYPVAMQDIMVRDDRCAAGRTMDKLDATLADYDVKQCSLIDLCMSREFAIQAHREERGKVAKEIAAHATGDQK